MKLEMNFENIFLKQTKKSNERKRNKSTNREVATPGTALELT